jgi:hypothetical protein
MSTVLVVVMTASRSDASIPISFKVIVKCNFIDRERRFPILHCTGKGKLQFGGETQVSNTMRRFDSKPRCSSKEAGLSLNPDFNLRQPFSYFRVGTERVTKIV